jgi:type VI protein secretion system component Hcp
MKSPLLIEGFPSHKDKVVVSEVSNNKTNKRVCHTMALSFTFKSILWQMKNYGNSNISPCKNIIFEKSSQRNQNPLR